MQSDLPLISVIIPAYNQADYLVDCVQSVLDQTYPSVEAIIVDDGSTDHTPEVGRSFADPRVRYIRQENRGLSGARNTGIRQAQGAYLSYLDSDDLFLPEKLAVLAEVLADSPETGLVAGQAIPIDESRRQVGRVFDKPLPADPAQLLLGNPLHVGSVLMRRDWQQKVGFFDERLRSYEDWDMWLRLGLAGCKMAWVDRPVSLYRFHTAQMTRIGSQMTTATFAVLDKFFSREEIPPAWLALKDWAYSNAHLRAAAQAYLAEDFALAQGHLGKATRLNPTLLENQCAELAARFASWIELPKSQDPLRFLEMIYNNLPGDLSGLQARQREELGKAALHRAFAAHDRGEPRATRAAVLQAMRYRPAHLLNRGVLSIFFQSLRPPVEP